MNFDLLAASRYSVRGFQERPVEPEKLEKVLEAGRLAPTACNFQPQRLYLISSEEGKEKLRKTGCNFFSAPHVIAVCYDSSVSWKRPFDKKDIGDVDAAIVGTHLMLQAADLGLGTTWIGYFDPAAFLREFELPENIVPVALFPIGYPAMDPAPKHTQRNTLNVPQL